MNTQKVVSVLGFSFVIIISVCLAFPSDPEEEAKDKEAVDEQEEIESDILKQLGPTKSSRVLRTTYYLSRIETDWLSARQHCLDHRLRLLSIEDLEEDAEITAFLNDERVLRAWTSGNDIDRNGNFVWSSTGRPFVYTNWHSQGVPKDPRRNCVFTATDRYWGDGTYGWDEEHCSNRHKFICEETL